MRRGADATVAKALEEAKRAIRWLKGPGSGTSYRDSVRLGDLGDRGPVAEGAPELLALDPDRLRSRVEAGSEVAVTRTAGTTIGQALTLDQLGDAIGQLGDGGLEPLGGGGDHGVDHGLDVDSVGLGDLRDRLALLEGGAQLLFGDADRVGGHLQLHAAVRAGAEAFGRRLPRWSTRLRSLGRG